MEPLLKVNLLNNNKSHDDLLFSVTGLTAELKFDSYYFEFKNVDGNFKGLKECFIKLFKYWLAKSKRLFDGEMIFLPINFSDQCTGCLRVVNLSNEFYLTYGDSRREGYSIDPTDPADYCYDVTDFSDGCGKTIKVSMHEFTYAISSVIGNLEKD